MKEFLKARLTEPSTWRGVFALLGAAGIALSPGQQDAILIVVLGVLGVLGIGTKDTGSPR